MCEHGTPSTILPTPDWLWDARAVPENGICIDACIAETIRTAWEHGVRTLGSCCGHGEDYRSVVLTEDSEQPELARRELPGWRLHQWQLVDVSCGRCTSGNSARREHAEPHYNRGRTMLEPRPCWPWGHDLADSSVSS